MKRFSTLITTALMVGGMFLSAGAKQTLPVTVHCTNAGATGATVRVKLLEPATSFTVTVGGTGSVVMKESVRSSPSVSKSQEVIVPVTFTSGTTDGGLVVEVRGDFGRGVRSQIQTFSLVPGASGEVRARTHSGKAASPDIVIVPAKTTTEGR